MNLIIRTIVAVTLAVASPRGFGHVQLNDRYQLVGNGEAPVAFAPRETLVTPSGRYERGLGFGGLGLQIGLPLSVVFSKSLVSHTNLGGTILFSAKNTAGATKRTPSSPTSASNGPSSGPAAERRPPRRVRDRESGARQGED
jgi:hypothetical protein